MVATVLQPIVEGTKKAAAQLDSVIRTGRPAYRGEAGPRLHADHQGERRRGQQLRPQRSSKRKAFLSLSLGIDRLRERPPIPVRHIPWRLP